MYENRNFILDDGAGQVHTHQPRAAALEALPMSGFRFSVVRHFIRENQSEGLRAASRFEI